MKLNRWFKLWWQRRTRGWDDRETWNLDVTLARHALPRLRRFAELTNGHPPDLSWEEWADVLRAMVRGFELVAAADGGPLDPGADREVREGLALFAEYYPHLWW